MTQSELSLLPAQCVNACLLQTVHLVALYEALILLVNGGGSSGEGFDVIIQIPAQVFVKYCSQEVEFFIIVFLHGRRQMSK